MNQRNEKRCQIHVRLMWFSCKTKHAFTENLLKSVVKRARSNVIWFWRNVSTGISNAPGWEFIRNHIESIVFWWEKTAAVYSHSYTVWSSDSVDGLLNLNVAFEAQMILYTCSLMHEETCASITSVLGPSAVDKHLQTRKIMSLKQMSANDILSQQNHNDLHYKSQR